MTTNTMTRLRPDDDYFVPEWTLGDRMRKALEASGTPVHEIAEYLDVSRVTIGRWLHDRSPVKKSTLIIWSATTGVDLDWLETGTAGLENQTGLDLVRHEGLEPPTRWLRVSRHLTLVGSVNRGLTVDRIPGEFPPDWTPEPGPALLRVVS